MQSIGSYYSFPLPQRSFAKQLIRNLKRNIYIQKGIMFYQIDILRWCTGLSTQNEDVTRICQLFYPVCSSGKFCTLAYSKLAVYYMLKGHNYFKNRLLRKPHNQSIAAGIKITGRSSSIIKKLELYHTSYTPGQVKHTEPLVNILESRMIYTEDTQFYSSLLLHH